VGLGDWILATAEAKHYNEKHKLPVAFRSPKTGKFFWSEVFRNNPRILKDPYPGQKFVAIHNAAGSRPYIKEITTEKVIYNMAFKAEPGELFLTKEEKATSLPGCVLIEPHTKDKEFSRNKAWPWERWQELVNRNPDVPWVQLGNAEAKSLNGVKRVVTKSFRDALGYVNGCALVVTTDGALHHAAAALGKLAVVLWGGLAPHTVLGYDSHINICKTYYSCGSLLTCKHCRDAMDAITVDEVQEALETSLQGLAAGRGRGDNEVPSGAAGQDRDRSLPTSEASRSPQVR
jgi:ADP-heptose:LPS heptosyltransferase